MVAFLFSVSRSTDLNYHLEGRDLAKHFGCKFIETSAKQRINVDEAFSNLVREIRKYNKVRTKFNFIGFGCLFAREFRNNKLAVRPSRETVVVQLGLMAARTN